MNLVSIYYDKGDDSKRFHASKHENDKADFTWIVAPRTMRHASTQLLHDPSVAEASYSRQAETKVINTVKNIRAKYKLYES